MHAWKPTDTWSKWTGSQVLGERFKNEVLADPKSFTRRDFEPLRQKYTDLQTNLRASAPTSPEVTTPSESRRSSVQQPAPQPERQTYWNEFDDGSEVEDEPYTIYVDPDADSQMFGAKTFASLMSKARGPMEKVREWMGPMASPRERRPLLTSASYFQTKPRPTPILTMPRPVNSLAATQLTTPPFRASRTSDSRGRESGCYFVLLSPLWLRRSYSYSSRASW